MNRVSRTIYAGLLAALLAFNGQANAQAIVHDPLNFTELIAQLKQMFETYSVLQKSFNEQQQTVASLQHSNPQVMGIAQALMTDVMRLPGSPSSAMPGLNYGSNLSASGQSFYTQNHYYTPQGNDFAATEMERRQIATANLQGEAKTGMDRVSQRITSLTQLENSIPGQMDVTAVSAINARLGSERMFLANENNNIQHLQLLQQTQQHVDQQRGEQHSRQMAEQWDTAISAQAWGN